MVLFAQDGAKVAMYVECRACNQMGILLDRVSWR